VWRLSTAGFSSKSGCGGVWSQIEIGGVPPLLRGHAVTYDPWCVSLCKESASDSVIWVCSVTWLTHRVSSRLLVFSTPTDRPSSQLEVWSIDVGTIAVVSPRDCHVAVYMSSVPRGFPEADRPVWRSVCTPGPGPSPRSSHVAVSLQPTPLELRLFPSLIPSTKPPLCEDTTRPGYWHVMPLGYGGPYSPKHMRHNVHGGCVFDPTPEVEAELRFHAQCRRVIVFGGLSSGGTFLPMDEVFHYCLGPPQSHRPVLPDLVVPSPSHATRSSFARTSKPTRAGSGVQSWAPLSMSPIKVPRSLVVRVCACVGALRFSPQD
jgi:hypothetical protein